MYYELIWTRCGSGIDIQRGGARVESSGFKVYACADAVLQGELMDLSLLTHLAQTKLPAREPDLMEDAYLYAAPDRGCRMMMNGHLIPFQQNEEGGFAQRGGNFINHVLLGDFEEFYPYETFGCDAVWNAKTRGEAYYYETPSESLPPREIVPAGGIRTEDVAAFIADGRRGLLKQAVAFLIRQFSLPPNERQFLVIRDENEQQIELWIAAAELAFSPQIAAGLSFATRMDRFQTNNIYTVNQSGQYLTQKNFSDPKQIRRFYAMLVGADARDGTNFSAAKAFPNSPFAVLDGMSRRFSVQEDCSHPFYEGVTAYDGAHREFCREFLQMTPLSAPSQELLPLYEAYAALHRFAEGGSAADCAAGVQGIIRFQVRVTPYLNRLYETVRSRFSAMLCEDAVSGLSVLHWLEITADALGDSRAIPELHKTVCGVMIREGYLHPADSAVHALFDAVCRMTEAKKTAKSFVSVQMAEQFSKQMLAYSPAEWDAFTELFFACAETAQGMERAAGEAVLLLCAASSYRNKNGQKLVETAKKFTARRCISVRETLLDEAERTADRKYAHFLVQALVYAMPEQVSSGEKLNKLYNDLELRGRAECFSAALLLKAETVTDPSKIAAFLTAVCTNEAFQELELAPVFQALDRNLRIGDADAAKAAGRIQTAKPRALKCIQSAHIYALTVLDGKYTGEKLDKVLKGLAAQGFPCAEEDTYADELIRLVMRPSVPDSTFRLMTEAAARSGYYCQRLTDALFADGSRQSYERLALLTEAAAAMNSAAYADALTRRCSRLKRMSRQIAEIRSRLTTDAARDYLAEIEAAAEKLAAQNAQPSLLQKLFGKGTE